MVRSIQSVEGARILVPPTPGSGERYQTLAIVELSGKPRLAALTAAIEEAQTHHRDTILPGVDTAITGKLKPDATPEAIMDALRQADLLEE